MSEEEVWVRMVAATLSTTADNNPTGEIAAEVSAGIADAAVEQWRKRYGKPAEQPAKKVIRSGDRVIIDGRECWYISGRGRLFTVRWCDTERVEELDTTGKVLAASTGSPHPPAFKVGDRVRINGYIGEITAFCSEFSCVVEFPVTGKMVFPIADLTLDPDPERR